jgi:hypothetical protein
MGSDLYMNPPGQLERDRVVRAAVEVVKSADDVTGPCDKKARLRVPKKTWEVLVKCVENLKGVR